MSRLLSTARISCTAMIFAVASYGCVGDDQTDESRATVAELNSPDIRPAGHYGYGLDASPEEIAGWDIDIRPDGVGLPEGSGTAEGGEMLYENQCASCHGSFGEGVGRYPVLSGGEGSLTEARPEKTVGSFWPYASTLWDYIHRAMPYTEPESLNDDEVYAITAYVLYLNDLVDYDFELTRHNLTGIEMPNRDGFYVDDRPDVNNELCMQNCKELGSVRITSEPEAAESDSDPADKAVVVPTLAGETVYQQACALCHAAGLADAPVPGNNEDWSERLTLGRNVMLENVLSGKGAMPPQGGLARFSDADVAAAVDFMLSQSRN